VTHRYVTPFDTPRGTPPTNWPDNNGFLDKPYAPMTGLTHVGAREYDATTGRFLSVDPEIDPTDTLSLAAYTYAANNPVTGSDPTGLSRVADTAAWPMSVICDGGYVPGCVRDTTPGWLSGNEPVGHWSDLGWGALNTAYGAFKDLVRLAPLSIPVAGPILEASGFGNWLANKLPDRVGGGNPKTQMYQAGGFLVNVCLLVCTLGAGEVADSLAIGGRLAAETVPDAAKVLKGPIADAVPKNLPQQMALDAAKQGAGKQIMANLGDAPRLIANYGEGRWVKMQYVLRGNYSNVTVHYFRNLDSLLDVEFKFK
jgi:RHS repeat-associated protein